MFKKFKVFVATLLSVIILAGCSNSTQSSNDKVIKVAAQIPSMIDIVEEAGRHLEDGYQLEVVKVNDNIQYNELLNNKEVDANFAQHEPFMQKYNEEKGGNLVQVAKIYNVPVGFYSKDYQSIDEIPEGTKVAIPNDPANESRALNILQEQGLIKLKDGVGQNGRLKDVVENPKNFEWLSVDLLNLAEAYDEPGVSLIFCYPAYIKKVGLTVEDAIFVEQNIDDRFAIGVSAREDNQDSDKIRALVKAMTSDEVRDFMEREQGDTVIPAF